MSDALREQLQASLGAAYSLDRELPGGGMSRVFEARDLGLSRTVVVKVLSPELAAGVSIERFKREIQFAAGLQHPHIVPLLSAGVASGLPFYTMPRVEGETLRARLERERPLLVAEAVRLISDVAGALAYSHARGLVHRDIKPENIFVSGGHALVSDFGVAKAIAAAEVAPSTITTVGMAIGSPAYMAPEQATADPSTDHRADIYALGAVAYEMLAGQRLFAGRPSHALLAAHLMDVPDSVSKQNPLVPQALAALVARCLEKDPAARPQSAAEIVEQLETVRFTDATTGAFAGSLKSWRTRRGSFALAVGAFLVAGLFLGYRLTRRGAPATGPVTAAPAAGPAIAVLPFVNMSGSRDNEYFSDGMTEELIQALGAVRGLQVAARTSSFAFKGQNLTVQDIGKRLHVSHVVEASVRQSGRRLRITAELIKVSDGYRMWSKSYDREPRDVFQVQDEISHSIARAMSSALGISLPAAPALHRAPKDLAAYDLYLKGRFFWNKRSPDGLKKAVAFFQQAIARDSTYALAYSGLGDSYAIESALGFLEPKTGYAIAKPIVLRALQLDSTLAEAHTSLGFVHLYYDLDPAAAKRELERAIALDPRYATAHLFYAWYYMYIGDVANGIREASIARDLEPLSLIINTRLGAMLSYEGRLAEAERQVRKTIELDSMFAPAYVVLANLLAERGQYEASIASARHAMGLTKNGAGILGYSLAKSGRTAEAESILRDVIASSTKAYVPPNRIALIYVGLGDYANALKWLARCFEVRDTEEGLLRVEPLYAPLRGDPRFVAILNSRPKN